MPIRPIAKFCNLLKASSLAVFARIFTFEYSFDPPFMRLKIGRKPAKSLSMRLSRNVLREYSCTILAAPPCG